MNRRYGPLLPALLLELLASAGCLSWQGYMPQMAVAEPPAGPIGCAGELTPTQAAQLCLTAGELLEKNGSVVEAIRQYENARKHDPRTPAVSRRLAVLYDLHGDAARAETEYLRALQQRPRDAELLNDFGYFHYRHNQPQQAEHWLRSAVAVDPNCACAWINLGQVLARQGRAEESYQAFTHVLRPAEAYSNLGVVLAKQGRTAEARQALQQAVKLDPRLMPPQAFLTALADVSKPLPPGRLTHPAPPVMRMSATKPASSVPPRVANFVETTRPAKRSTTPACNTPPPPPPDPPSSPPLAVLAAACKEEAIPIRPTASTVPPVVPRTSPAAPRPLPRPASFPVPDKPRPQAILTDCQGEHEPENGPQ